MRLHALDHRGRRRGAGDHGLDACAACRCLQLVGRVDQHAVHDRRAAVVGHAVRRAISVEDRLGLDLAQADVGAGARPPSSRGSTSRCSGTSAASTGTPGACGMSQSRMLPTRVQVGAAVVVDHALRVAGGARGVVERDRVPLVRRAAARRSPGRPPARNCLVARWRRAARRSGVAGSSTSITSELAGLRAAPAPARSMRRELPVGDQHLGLAVVEHEGDGSASRRVLSVLSTAPAMGTPKCASNIGGHVGQHGRHGVAGPHAAARPAPRPAGGSGRRSRPRCGAGRRGRWPACAGRPWRRAP